MKLNYKVIDKEKVPPEEPLVTDKTILYDLFKTLPFDKAICIKCNSWADQQDKRQLVWALSAKLRKEGFKLAAQKTEKPLSPKRQEAYEKSKAKGAFRRVCYLYVWKERLD